MEVEVGAIAEARRCDYLALQLKDCDVGTIKDDALWLSRVLELVEDRRRHGEVSEGKRCRRNNFIALYNKQ